MAATSPAFGGLRVLDLGTFWAGPFLGSYLGAFGADVIKVESTRRPDGFRFVAAFPRQGDDWFERSGLFQATNLNKRGVTIDLTIEAGQDVFAVLVESADVVIENFSPRVMEQLGFPYERLTEIRPDIIMVRMPGFGLEGPGRDHVGFGNSFEYFGGMGWITGYPDGPPAGPGGYADPIVGMHAAVAVQAALEHRQLTGAGQRIEVAQVDVVANVTAEQVIHTSLTGEVLGRRGNRSVDAAPQGVYQCRHEEDWVALTVRSDTEWASFRDIVGDRWPSTDLSTLHARQAHHDALDAVIAGWTAGQEATDVEKVLLEAGIPAKRVMITDRMYDDPHLDARRYYDRIEHPLTGVRRYPGWPMRISTSSPQKARSPLLGEHNEEVLGEELGLTPVELQRLREAGVIGQSPRSSA